MKIQKTMALCLVSMMFLNAGSVFAADASTSLVAGIKTLQAAIDSGSMKPADAVDQFSKTIVDQNISLNDVNAFVKTQMTSEQFSKFQGQMDSSMRGIDPTTLTPSETGEMVGQSLAQIHTEGLYWSGCANVWTGAAIIAAAIIAGSIAVVKSKSISSIQSDYNNRIANSTTYYNQEISDTNNWQTAFPQRINSLKSDVSRQQSDIQTYQSQLDDAQWNYNHATSQADQNTYASQISTYQSDISYAQNTITSDQNQISDYQSRMQAYIVNPAQAALDAQSEAQQRDAANINLQAQEKSAVAAAPANQALGRELGIGAGIGAAIGTGLLIYGFKEGACGY